MIISLARWVSLLASLWLTASGLCVQPTPPGSLSLDTIRAYLVQWEGYSLTPYRDGPGYSVGIGHSLFANREKVRPYSRAEVERFFYRDTSWVIDACRLGITGFDQLPTDVRLVCIGLAFGVGRTGFARFHQFRLALSHRAYNAAAHELGLSKWYRQQVSPARARAAYNTLLSQP